MAKVRVLVVDDERDFLDVLVGHLEKHQLDVRTAESGELALDSLAESLVDVVVMDVKMPGLTGIETLRWIRRDHPSVEVIMLTGFADLDASMLGMEQGAFDYLLKPVEMDRLAYRIQDAAQKKALRDGDADSRDGDR